MIWRDLVKKKSDKDIVECLHRGHLDGGWYDNIMKSGFRACLERIAPFLYYINHPALQPSLLEMAAQ